MCKKVTLIWALMCMFVMTSLAANKRFTLVIDPGHGGHDAGALGAISKEKNINLAVALRFGKYVEQDLPEVRVSSWIPPFNALKKEKAQPFLTAPC